MFILSSLVFTLFTVFLSLTPRLSLITGGPVERPTHHRCERARLVDDFKAGISKHVKLTGLRGLHWMLGIEVKRYRAAGRNHLFRRAYIDAIPHRFHLADIKPLSSPLG